MRVTEPLYDNNNNVNETLTLAMIVTMMRVAATSASYKELNQMARLVELGITLEGKEAEEFLENESSTKFTSSQIALFREAKRIYKSHHAKFES